MPAAELQQTRDNILHSTCNLSRRIVIQAMIDKAGQNEHNIIYGYLFAHTQDY